MAAKKVIAICQWGGEFEADADGELHYKGGEAHAMEIDEAMKFKDFKAELADMFNWNRGSSMSIKYFLPGNKKIPVSISNDKDLKRMIKFYNNCDTVEVFLSEEVAAATDVSNLQGSRTTMSEDVPIATSPSMMDNIVHDINEPGLNFDATFDIFGDTAHDEAQHGLPTEMPVAIVTVPSCDEKHAKAAQQWENIITGVGQRFNSVHEFREALRKYAIARQFAFKYKKNDGHRVTVKCKADGCPWRVHASRLSTTPLICIKKMNPTHTCEGAATNGYKVTRSWVASIIKEKLKVYPNYKPKDIVTDIKEEYGIQLNYFQAWRGKEIAKEQLQGSYTEAYSQLPFLCEKIMETNPGSLATFATKEDSSFHRLFVSFHASLFGFQQGCRPLLFLDSVFLKSKYQGSLLAANAIDGDDRFFPVAFAIVDVESEENWHWFLQQLKTALNTTCRGLTIVANREKGLRGSISEIFQGEEVYHGFCLRYLSEQLLRDLKSHFSHEVKRLLVEDLYNAAYAPKPEGFYEYMESIKSMSPEAYNWLMQSEPIHWANAFFEGSRYNHMVSNFGEMFYNWVSDAHELPITQMVDSIRCKIMELIYNRRTEYLEWSRSTRMTPSTEEKLNKESINVGNLQVLLISSTNIYQVQGDTIEEVDIGKWSCTCKGWQLMGLPCCHAIAVILWIQNDTYAYCSKYFTSEYFGLTYSESINPISNVDEPLQNENPSQAMVSVTPPPTRRPPGRPATKKAGSNDTGRRQLQCSRCKNTGHNKSTCKEFSLEC